MFASVIRSPRSRYGRTRRTRRPAAVSRSSSRRTTRSESRPGTCPRRRRREGRDLQDRPAGQAAGVLRLFRRRPARRLRGSSGRGDRRRSRWADRPVLEGGQRLGKAGGRPLTRHSRLAERIGLPWPREDGLIVQESVSRSTGGYAGLFDPTRGHAESPTTPTTSWSCTRPPTRGSTATSWPIAGRSRRSPRITPSGRPPSSRSRPAATS